MKAFIIEGFLKVFIYISKIKIAFVDIKTNRNVSCTTTTSTKTRTTKGKQPLTYTLIPHTRILYMSVDINDSIFNFIYVIFNVKNL